MKDGKVVIAGAGPAGLTAAKILAEGNKDVLIIEKNTNDRIGDKPCAGCIRPYTIKQIPPDLIENTVDHKNIWLGNKKILLRYHEPIVSFVSRLSLGQWQLKEAKSAGAEIFDNTKVIALDQSKNTVTCKCNDGEIEEINYDYLIGADGSNSIVRRSLGYDTKQRCLYVEYHIPCEGKNARNDLEIFIDLVRFGPTYAWIFPHGKYLSVGTGTLQGLLPMKEMVKRFESWADAVDIDLNAEGVMKRSWPIYMGYHGFQHGNIYLTGDAASFASTTTGEGIFQAMKSGEIAAKSILNPNWNYKMELIKLLVHHYSGGWIIPFAVEYPKFSLKIAENIGKNVLPSITPIASLFADIFNRLMSSMIPL